MSEKLPWFKFETGEWKQRTALLSPATKGILADILCLLWIAPERGTFTADLVGWARACNADVTLVKQAFGELIKYKVANIVTLSNGDVTFSSPWQIREDKGRNQTKERVRKHRERKRNEDVTQHSNALVTVQSKEVRSKKLENNNSIVSSLLDVTLGNARREALGKIDELEAIKKPKPKKWKFIPPTPEEAEAYADTLGYKLNGIKFVAHYEKVGWRAKSGPITSWKACVKTWKENEADFKPKAQEEAEKAERIRKEKDADEIKKRKGCQRCGGAFITRDGILICLKCDGKVDKEVQGKLLGLLQNPKIPAPENRQQKILEAQEKIKEIDRGELK